VEVDVWNLLVLCFSAVTSSKSVWHNPAVHTFALNIFFHNWVEIIIWDHVQGGSSVSHNGSVLGVEFFSSNFNVMEIKHPKLWVGNFVELEISLGKFISVISSEGDFTLTLGIDVHGKEISFDSSLLVKGWNEQLGTGMLS
jgi:hypothetical protein